MQKIQVLSQAVADQIAAGEVAERPASVVKELVENSIDAGATRIDVEIKQGGIAYIRVTDNGQGIPKEQVETAFLRHATSKLSTIDDLEKIVTMGFRGEALASICAVAEVEVITKTKDSDEGCYLEVIHGIPSGKEEMACPDGTTMVVKRLFANVPARMKFLKKDATEAGYIADVLGRIALSHPEIAFTYICDDNEIFATSGDGKLINAILKIYGLDHAKGVIPVDYTEDNIKITGVIGKPELARGNRTRQTLFVNGRYIKNHVVSKVAEEAYRNSIMVGRFPFFVLNISLPTEQVDVNVHPAKTEIKFASEKRVYDVMYHAVHSALYREEKPAEEKREETETAPKKIFNIPAYKSREEEPPVRPQVVRQFLEYTTPKQEFSEPIETSRLSEPTAEETFKMAVEENPVQESMTEIDFKEEENFKIVGQVFDTYIICQKGEEMFMIDQHAAHERRRFEDLKKMHINKEKMTQMLLSPMVIQLDFNEKQTVMDNMVDYRAFGFEIEDFGGTSIIVHGTPVIADQNTIRDLILEIGGALSDQRKHPVNDFEERVLDMISCKYAIKANHKLSLMEMEDLINCVAKMEKEGVKTCPHGRPIRIAFTKAEIEKLFKRRV